MMIPDTRSRVEAALQDLSTHTVRCPEPFALQFAPMPPCRELRLTAAVPCALPGPIWVRGASGGGVCGGAGCSSKSSKGTWGQLMVSSSSVKCGG